MLATSGVSAKKLLFCDVAAWYIWYGLNHIFVSIYLNLSPVTINLVNFSVILMILLCLQPLPSKLLRRLANHPGCPENRSF